MVKKTPQTLISDSEARGSFHLFSAVSLVLPFSPILSQVTEETIAGLFV